MATQKLNHRKPESDKKKSDQWGAMFIGQTDLTVNPLLSPLGGLFISSPIEGMGGLFEMGASAYLI